MKLYLNSACNISHKLDDHTSTFMSLVCAGISLKWYDEWYEVLEDSPYHIGKIISNMYTFRDLPDMYKKPGEFIRYAAKLEMTILSHI